MLNWPLSSTRADPSAFVGALLPPGLTDGPPATAPVGSAGLGWVAVFDGVAFGGDATAVVAVDVTEVRPTAGLGGFGFGLVGFGLAGFGLAGFGCSTGGFA